MIVTLILLALLGAISAYSSYQIMRFEKIIKIRIKWLHAKDSRYYIYENDDMLAPNVKNWFGLRWPNEKHYK